MFRINSEILGLPGGQPLVFKSVMQRTMMGRVNCYCMTVG